MEIITISPQDMESFLKFGALGLLGFVLFVILPTFGLLIHAQTRMNNRMVDLFQHVGEAIIERLDDMNDSLVLLSGKSPAKRDSLNGHISSSSRGTILRLLKEKKDGKHVSSSREARPEQ